jgi:hypothetical protein
MIGIAEGGRILGHITGDERESPSLPKLSTRRTGASMRRHPDRPDPGDA